MPLPNPLENFLHQFEEDVQTDSENRGIVSSPSDGHSMFHPKGSSFADIIKQRDTDFLAKPMEKQKNGKQKTITTTFRTKINTETKKPPTSRRFPCYSSAEQNEEEQELIVHTVLDEPEVQSEADEEPFVHPQMEQRPPREVKMLFGPSGVIQKESSRVSHPSADVAFMISKCLDERSKNFIHKFAADVSKPENPNLPTSFAKFIDYKQENANEQKAKILVQQFVSVPLVCPAAFNEPTAIVREKDRAITKKSSDAHLKFAYSFKLAKKMIREAATQTDKEKGNVKINLSPLPLNAPCSTCNSNGKEVVIQCDLQ